MSKKYELELTEDEFYSLHSIMMGEGGTLIDTYDPMVNVEHLIGSIKSVEAYHEDLKYYAEIQCFGNSIYDISNITLQTGEFVVKDLDGRYRVYDRRGLGVSPEKNYEGSGNE